MRSLILCEGIDEVLILGYFLFKKAGWYYKPKEDFANDYKFPRPTKSSPAPEVYCKDDEKLAIWAVGGKDSFSRAYKLIRKALNNTQNEYIDNVFIVADRDENEVQECLKKIQTQLADNGIIVSELVNHSKNEYRYEIDDEELNMNIIPIVVPFDKNGAIETVLMEGIEENGEEERYIVQKANNYIDEIIESGRLNKYLQHDRLILKARLSAAISITNPDRSTGMYDNLLMSWDWEEKESVKRHFGILLDYVS